MHRLFPSSKLPHIFLNLICFVGIYHGAMSFKREIRSTFQTNLTQHLQCLTANIPVCNVTRPMRIDIKKSIGVDGSREPPKLLCVRNISSSDPSLSDELLFDDSTWIDQFPYFRIQSKTIDANSSLLGRN